MSDRTSLDTAVIDASLVVDLLLDASLWPVMHATVGAPELITAPHLTLEVLNALRRKVLGPLPDRDRIAAAVEMLPRLPIDPKPIDHLVPQIWLRHSTVTAYDAAYAALAAEWDCPLLTRDARLARAPGVGCEVYLFE